jgi:hypothetical protein
MTSAVAFATNDVDLYPDIVKKWGLSFLINTAKTPQGRSPGSLAWAGLANTYFWIDPARDVTGVIPDAAVAVRRQEVPGSLCGLRERRLCRPRCRQRPKGGVTLTFPLPALRGERVRVRGWHRNGSVCA